MNRKTYGTAVAIIKEARQILLDNRWGQNSFRRIDSDGKMCYCAMGALDQAASFEFIETMALRRAVAMVEDCITPAPWSLVAWNDTPGREKGEVINLFDRAIEKFNVPESA